MLRSFSKLTSQNSECNNSFFDKHFDIHHSEWFKMSSYSEHVKQSSAISVNYEKKRKMHKKIQCQQLPIEIWDVILSSATLISKLRFRSTCRGYYTDIKVSELRKAIISFFVNMNPLDFKYPKITHLITNIPLNLYPKGLYIIINPILPIHLSEFKIHKLTDGYWYVDLAKYATRNFNICIGDDTYNNGPDINYDSEILHGRHKIIDELPFQPIHTSYTSKWVASTLDNYVVLVCTESFVVKKSKEFK